MSNKHPIPALLVFAVSTLSAASHASPPQSTTSPGAEVPPAQQPAMPAGHEHHHHPAPQEKTEGPTGDSQQDDLHAHPPKHTGPYAAEVTSTHIPPPPPQHAMPDMSYREMVRVMRMDDTERFGKVTLDQLEWTRIDSSNVLSWDAQAWYGGDYHKLWLKTEGERERGAIESARAEALWDRVVSPWWSLQLGLRQDLGEGPSRTWAALGMQGLAPHWLEIEVTAYVGEQGRSAVRFAVERDLLLTQRLVLQPELEANLYGRSDRALGRGSGLSDLELALRLRYEIRREFAPYVGLGWVRQFGGTADFTRAEGEDPSDLHLMAGIRAWF